MDPKHMPSIAKRKVNMVKSRQEMIP